MGSGATVRKRARERQARALLADFGVPVAGPRLRQRAAVDYAATAGRRGRELSVTASCLASWALA